MKDIKDIMKIKSDDEYRPREIANNGWILNTRRRSDYYFVLKLIKEGILPARNVAISGNNPYFVVLGQDILNYHDEIKKRSKSRIMTKKNSQKDEK